tara:strand:+ start:31 stop:426 length:396 start_codon:yes stop_codon:yes gene_type:complete
MGDRFYFQQQRRKRMPWEEAKKQQAIEKYTSEEPTPENSMEIVKDISTELGESPNGVRNILVRAGVYVKKTPATRSSSSKTNGGRVSVADAQATLASAIRDTGEEPDETIISKLTGKAANYFAAIINKVNE